MAAEKKDKPSVRENFVRHLENQIISGQLKLGDKLPPAKELCSLMGVSLTVVNAGMSELVSKGFIETVPRQGSYVADYKKKGNTDTFISIMRYNGGTLTETEARSFIETRMAIDPFVVDLVVERCSDEEISQLVPLCEKMEKEKDRKKLCRLVTEFYYKLTAISGNTFMALLYHSTAEPQACVYGIYFDKNGSDTTVNTCKKLLELIQARDAEGAKKLVLTALGTALSGEMAVV